MTPQDAIAIINADLDSGKLGAAVRANSEFAARVIGAYAMYRGNPEQYSETLVKAVSAWQGSPVGAKGATENER